MQVFVRVQALMLRLDDDMEWRVAGIVELTMPAPRVSRPPSALSDALGR
jgi:hypothetical protein